MKTKEERKQLFENIINSFTEMIRRVENSAELSQLTIAISMLIGFVMMLLSLPIAIIVGPIIWIIKETIDYIMYKMKQKHNTEI